MRSVYICETLVDTINASHLPFGFFLQPCTLRLYPEPPGAPARQTRSRARTLKKCRQLKKMAIATVPRPAGQGIQPNTYYSNVGMLSPWSQCVNFDLGPYTHLRSTRYKKRRKTHLFFTQSIGQMVSDSQLPRKTVNILFQ